MPLSLSIAPILSKPIGSISWLFLLLLLVGNGGSISRILSSFNMYDTLLVVCYYADDFLVVTIRFVEEDEGVVLWIGNVLQYL